VSPGRALFPACNFLASGAAAAPAASPSPLEVTRAKMGGPVRFDVRSEGAAARRPGA